MKINKSVRENLQFLIAEVNSQLDYLMDYLRSASPLFAQKIMQRRAYTANLKNRIHASCLRQISQNQLTDQGTQYLRAFEFIATELERISELCRDSVKQVSNIEHKDEIDFDIFESLLSKLINAIAQIDDAILANDSSQALKIGQMERKLDNAFKKILDQYVKYLKRESNTRELVSVLFLAHNIEQMGDALLDVSEAILSANLGQPVNTDRYFAFETILEQLNEANPKEIQIKSVAETRSGSGISAIRSGEHSDSALVAIFKDGEKHKLKEEREGVESWHEIYPGLAPQILAYHKKGNTASLLIEHLAGYTFENILLHERLDLLNEALYALGNTLKSVWRETRTNQSVAAGYMQQLRKRLPDVYAIHPEFRQSKNSICGFESLSFDQLLKRVEVYEKQLQAPFSVYIHGDFNLDNIIYDPVEKQINFIDLHRSRYMDYVQDVSVFMVSIYRLQVLDKNLRRRMAILACDFYEIAREYANKNTDSAFELRLALGLARSFATSTRFILDKSLAKAMLLRARYLMSLVLTINPEKPKKFKVPVKEIFIG